MLGLALVLCALLGAGPLASVAAAESCPNAAFRSGPSTQLPDCRAYEQVTPFESDGGKFTVTSLGVGPEGTSTLSLESLATFAGAENDEKIDGANYLLHRTATGWTTTAAIPPASQYRLATPVDFFGPDLLQESLDGGTSAWFGRSNGSPENRVDLITDNANGTIADIGPITPPGAPPVEDPDEEIEIARGFNAQLRGVSDDLSHLIFELNPNEAAGNHYWPFDGTLSGRGSLYEYVGANNSTPWLVGIDSEGKQFTCGTYLGGGSTRNNDGSEQEHNAVSGDGTIVYFTAEAGESGCAGPPVGELFARVDNGLADARTVAISEPSEIDCPSCDTGADVLQAAQFAGASQDGTTVFFTTSQPLIGGDSSTNIYEYDFEPPAGQPKVVRASGGDSTVEDPVAGVEGVVRTSEDGSHVYFVAHGVLTKTPNGRGQFAREGSNNFYVFERDAQYPTGRTEFISDLPDADSALWSEEGDFEGSEHKADLTPEGRFLVFVSSGDLTPDDTSSQPQVFEYDSQSGALLRVSIGEDGYNDNGNNDAIEPDGVAKISAPNFVFYDNPRQYWSGLTMSANGAYVFFASSLALTPQASNDEQIESEEAGRFVNVMNIYEYHDGNVYLISDPTEGGAYDRLLGTDASGADVFFEAGGKLVPQDVTLQKNVFDARIDGGFPAPANPPACSGDGCQGPLSAAPVLLSPGSEFQAGGGNFAPATSPSVAEKQAKKKTKKQAKEKPRARARSKKSKGKAGTTRRGHGKAGRS